MNLPLRRYFFGQLRIGGVKVEKYCDREEDNRGGFLMSPVEKVVAQFADIKVERKMMKPVSTVYVPGRNLQ